MTKEKKKNPLQISTPKFRVSFPELFTAKTNDDGENPEYSLKMLFSKKTDMTEMKRVVERAAKEKWGDKVPKSLQRPFVDGDTKDYDGYEGQIVVRASSKYKPKVCDRDPNVEITSSEDLYPGCYARAVVLARAYEAKDKKGTVMKRGVSFRLVAVQKWEEGEPFINRPEATDLFDSLDDGSGDASNYQNDDMFNDEGPSSDDDNMFG